MGLYPGEGGGGGGLIGGTIKKNKNNRAKQAENKTDIILLQERIRSSNFHYNRNITKQDQISIPVLLHKVKLGLLIQNSLVLYRQCHRLSHSSQGDTTPLFQTLNAFFNGISRDS